MGTLGALEAGEAVAVDDEEEVFGAVVVVMGAIAAAAAARIEVAVDAAGDVTDVDEVSSAVGAFFLSSDDMIMCLVLCSQSDLLFCVPLLIIEGCVDDDGKIEHRCEEIKGEFVTSLLKKVSRAYLRVTILHSWPDLRREQRQREIAAPSQQ